MMGAPDLGRTRALLAACAARTPGAPAVLDEVREVLLGHYAEARRRFSDILELSFSWDAAGAHPYRYSYAFPSFRGDPGCGECLGALAAPLGEAMRAATDRVLRAAAHPAVAQ